MADHIKRLKIASKDAAFHTEDHTIIFKRLSDFIKDAKNNQMSEAQAFVPFPFLKRIQRYSFAVSNALLTPILEAHTLGQR